LGKKMLRRLIENRKALLMLGAAQLAICCLLALPGSARAVLPTPISACGILSVSGGVYQLTGPITATSGGDCITIAVPLVSLDLNGYTISGTGSGIGIHVLAKASDALIITSVFTNNPLVSGFTTGIQFDQFAHRGYIGSNFFIVNESTALEIDGANNVSGNALLVAGSSFGMRASNSSGDAFTATAFGPAVDSTPNPGTGVELDHSDASFTSTSIEGTEVGLHLISSSNTTLYVASAPHIDGPGGIALLLERSTDNVFAQYGAIGGNNGNGGIGISVSKASLRNVFVGGEVGPEIFVDAGSSQNRILDTGNFASTNQAVDLNRTCDQNVWFDNNFTSVNQPCIQ
jgi:hypothetical protein